MKNFAFIAAALMAFAAPAQAQTCGATAATACFVEPGMTFDAVCPGPRVFFRASVPVVWLSVRSGDPGLASFAATMFTALGNSTSVTCGSGGVWRVRPLTAGTSAAALYGGLGLLQREVEAAAGVVVTPACQACSGGPGPTLVAWTQADVDAVRASSLATSQAAAATLAAVQAQTVQAATTQAVLAAPAEQGRDWSVVGTLLASVLAGFVTAYRVV